MRHARADQLEWRDVPMPDSSGPVQLARLPAVDDDDCFRALVRFPRGWRREIAGHYPVFEEILVLEGALTIDAMTASAGGWLFVAAGETRHSTSAPEGCLAFARFGGAPRWIRAAP